MVAVLVTGMSGCGKSTVLAELGHRHLRVVDTDYGDWIRPFSPHDNGERTWDVDRMTSLLAGQDAGPLFVGGCVVNQGRFYPNFDAIVLLTAPPGTLLARIRTRTGNDFGKTSVEREQVERDIATVEPLLRAGATHVLDTRTPLPDVVDQLIAIAAAGSTVGGPARAAGRTTFR